MHSQPVSLFHDPPRTGEIVLAYSTVQVLTTRFTVTAACTVPASLSLGARHQNAKCVSLFGSRLSRAKQHSARAVGLVCESLCYLRRVSFYKPAWPRILHAWPRLGIWSLEMVWRRGIDV
jgi:hypothetical protein